MRKQSWAAVVLGYVKRQRGPVEMEKLAKSLAPTVAKLFPGNRNPRPKLRQLLQVLVSKGVIKRTAPGRYTVTKTGIKSR
jgi:hypothetical protein